LLERLLRMDAVREEAGIGCGPAEIDELIFEDVLDDMFNREYMIFEQMATALGHAPAAVRRDVFDGIE